MDSVFQTKYWAVDGLLGLLQIEDWADFVDEVLQTEEWTVKVDHGVDCMKLLLMKIGLTCMG